MNTLYSVIIISVVLIVLLTIIIRNLLKQIEQLEDRVISTIDETRSKVEISLNNMREIDLKQAFEKDDEVGETFSQLKKIIEDLNEEI